MLLCRILPCQRQGCNLWEIDLAEHQTLRELFDMMHKDVWKVLFKAAEVPPPIIEDRGLNVKRRANPVSYLYFKRCSFSQFIRGRDLSPHTNSIGLGNDSGAGRLSSSTG